MAKKRILTIGRQAGSGGLAIGKQLASRLGMEFYDKELLKLAAKESGLCETLFETLDEKPKSLLYSLVMDPYAVSTMMSAPYGQLEQDVYTAIFETIRRVADENPAVIVGRCADYALREREDCLKVFITAPLEARVARIMQVRGMSEDKARDYIRKTDRARAAYYNYYTNNKWGSASAYDLCIDSTALGVDGTVELLCRAMEI